jgi:4-hydroxy-tetrahydrodipicolinate reductase
MVRVIVAGACGRTGSAILRLAAADPTFLVTHIIESEAHPLVGTTISLPGSSVRSLTLEHDLDKVINEGDVVIDFTEPTACYHHFGSATANGKAIIVGTTGLPPNLLSEMRSMQGARAVISPNMSIGVNVLFMLTRKAAEILGQSYDVEIMEMHHNLKKDAPSGTAVKLRDVVTGTDQSRQWKEVTGRQGMVGQRQPDEIGVLALRAGDTVGEHTVFFVGAGERLELTHRAYSRDNFALGALTAAKWIFAQGPGIYDMNDVLNLR